MTGSKRAEPPPYKQQGDVLRQWRAGRTVNDLVAGWVDPRSGKPISVSRYQHWEYGNNAVPAKFWPEMSRRIGHPVGPLYAESEAGKSSSKGVKMIRADVILPLVRDLQTKIKLLESMVVKAVPNKKVRSAGYRSRKTPVEA